MPYIKYFLAVYVSVIITHLSHTLISSSGMICRLIHILHDGLTLHVQERQVYHQLHHSLTTDVLQPQSVGIKYQMGKQDIKYMYVINSQHASLFYCYRCQQNLVPGQRGADNGVTIGVEQSGEWTAYRLGGHNTALCAFLDPAANSFGEFLVTKTLMQQFLLSVRNCYKVTIMSI